MAQKKAKKTITFRIDPQILDKLAKASKEDKIVLNVLVNQIFENYVDWDRLAVKAGWIFLRKEIIKTMIDRLSEKEIQVLATKLAKEIMKDTLLAMRGRFDLDTWIGVTKHRSERSNFHYQQSNKDGQINIIINHEMGLKWSLFHKWYYQKMLKDLGAKVTVDYTAKTIVLSIR